MSKIYELRESDDDEWESLTLTPKELRQFVEGGFQCREPPPLSDAQKLARDRRYKRERAARSHKKTGRKVGEYAGSHPSLEEAIKQANTMAEIVRMPLIVVSTMGSRGYKVIWKKDKTDIHQVYHETRDMRDTASSIQTNYVVPFRTE